MVLLKGFFPDFSSFPSYDVVVKGHSDFSTPLSTMKKDDVKVAGIRSFSLLLPRGVLILSLFDGANLEPMIEFPHHRLEPFFFLF